VTGNVIFDRITLALFSSEDGAVYETCFWEIIGVE
jgi:hypothetical protein